MTLIKFSEAMSSTQLIALLRKLPPDLPVVIVLETQPAYLGAVKSVAPGYYRFLAPKYDCILLQAFLCTL